MSDDTSRSDLYLSACELAWRIRERTVSAREVIERSLARIDEIQPKLNAFCFVYPEEARARADEADRDLAAGRPWGPLHGVPIAIKDFTPTAGKVTTRGSVAFKDWVPEADPVIVQRLHAAGAILVGKTTTPEFAYSSFTESPLWGVTRNPWDPEHTPGGSSGGSAAAVATGCVALAEGTDMGGSVRIPAALCGVVGLKPSLGRIPMDILPTTFDSISHFGPLARTVDDAALFLAVTHGPDDADIQSLPERLHLDPPLARDLRGARVALSPDLGFFAVDEDVARNTLAMADVLRDLGAVVEEVALGWTREVVDAWYELWGVYLCAAFGHLRERYRAEMDPEVVRLMDAGEAMGAVAYRRLDEVRTRQWHELARVFARYEALVCPTMARPAPRVGLRERDFDDVDAEGRYAGLDMTCPFNNVGQCPALSVPSGFSRDGLPTGLQIVGHRFADRHVLEIGAALQAAADWTAKTPPL